MNVEIAERLAARRKELGLSQEALAEKLGVSRQAVSKWERSESSPDTDNLIALAQLYGVSLDELLYVDGEIQDDVVFEAVDRAQQRKAEQESQETRKSIDELIEDHVFRQINESLNDVEAATADVFKSAKTSQASNSSDTDQNVQNPGSDESSPETDDYVKVGLGGIHVKDGEDSVHLSWKDGVHVESKDGDNVHVGWTGIHVNEGSKKGSRVEASDGKDSFTWTEDGVYVNGEHFDSMRDARKKYKRGHLYTDKGGKIWLRFPFYLLAIMAYIAVGYATGEWGLSLFVFATIPFYYMSVHYLYNHAFGEYIAGLYPYATVVWYLWVGFANGAWHPSWVIFLTIPIVEWVVVSITRASSRRKEKNAVVDVENATPENKVESES